MWFLAAFSGAACLSCTLHLTGSDLVLRIRPCQSAHIVAARLSISASRAELPCNLRQLQQMASLQPELIRGETADQLPNKLHEYSPSLCSDL